jgi:hypothetical protein
MRHHFARFAVAFALVVVLFAAAPGTVGPV